MKGIIGETQILVVNQVYLLDSSHFSGFAMCAHIGEMVNTLTNVIMAKTNCACCREKFNARSKKLLVIQKLRNFGCGCREKCLWRTNRDL